MPYNPPQGWAFHIRENGTHKTFVFATKEQGFSFLRYHLNADCLSITEAHVPSDLRRCPSLVGVE